MIGSDAAVAETLLQGAGLLLFLSHSRDDEREADRIAHESLMKAGFPTNGLSTLFAHMQSRYESDKEGAAETISSWLRTHPSLTERIQTLRTGNNHKEKPALSDTEWNALKTICES